MVDFDGSRVPWTGGSMIQGQTLAEPVSFDATRPRLLPWAPQTAVNCTKGIEETEQLDIVPGSKNQVKGVGQQLRARDDAERYGLGVLCPSSQWYVTQSSDQLGTSPLHLVSAWVAQLKAGTLVGQNNVPCRYDVENLCYSYQSLCGSIGPNLKAWLDSKQNKKRGLDCFVMIVSSIQSMNAVVI